MGFLSLLALLALGVLMFWKPEWIWQLEHLLSVKDGEPTDFYLARTRIAGAVFALIAVFCAISYL